MSKSWNIESKELGALRKDLQRLIKEYPDSIEEIVTSATGEMESAVRGSYDHYTDVFTGNLMGGIKADVKRTADNRVTGMVKNDAPHVHWFEYGTGPRYHDSTGKYVGFMLEFAPLRKAFDGNQGRIYSAAEQQLFQALERQLRR